MNDEFLNRLVGSWSLTGKMGSTELRQKVEARWVIQSHFVEVHCLEEKLSSRDQNLYEAIYMIGHDSQSGEYSMHLFDTFGAGYARTVGVGTRQDNSIEFLFPYPNGLFSNTFTWHSTTDEWKMLLRQKDETDKWKVFAIKSLSREEI